jgi:hypothetical protein
MQIFNGPAITSTSQKKTKKNKEIKTSIFNNIRYSRGLFMCIVKTKDDCFVFMVPEDPIKEHYGACQRCLVKVRARLAHDQEALGRRVQRIPLRHLQTKAPQPASSRAANRSCGRPVSQAIRILLERVHLGGRKSRPKLGDFLDFDGEEKRKFTRPGAVSPQHHSSR